MTARLRLSKAAHKGAKTGAGALPASVRRARLLDEIAAERMRMRQAALVVVASVNKADGLRQQVLGARHWLYPAAPLLALLAFRFKPRLASFSGLATRAWSIWKLYRRFR